MGGEAPHLRRVLPILGVPLNCTRPAFCTLSCEVSPAGKFYRIFAYFDPFSSTRRTVRQADEVKVKGLGLNISYLA